MTGDLSGGDLSRLRRLNALAVIGVLRGEPALTLTEVARRTGLSRASTEDVVRELLERGWMIEAEPTAGTVGRPARRYRFHADAGRVLGVDIGGHKILALVADLDGAVTHTGRVAVTPQMGRRQRLAAVDRAVGAVLADAGLEAAEVWASGVATTGLVDATGRVMLSEALPEWTGVNVASHVGRLVSGPVLVENDGKLAALAESWRGVARYAKDVVFLLAGLRTGAGLIIDGKLHRGFGNAAGEIGALPAARWVQALEHLRSWPGDDPPADPDAAVEDLFLAARDGDRKAGLAVRRYVKDLAVGASALVLTLDPELVVIGGGFSRSGDLILEPLRRELDRWCVRTPEIRVSGFGDEGVALGAVRLALDHVDAVLHGPGELVDPKHFLTVERPRTRIEP
ncbi:Sugar kinase of the NBD/HSP70 family, may contain an N-terminal HTH domain [Streptosporangium subroseum]|uniref:Sugar kinase of the NBD/HSP70 family, may contain an N-terminal HTH domain n=1 Tax=Streptosporangium subroseum TaxID=106412 RepID=A0A239NG66_9ACTN|nr:ROK family protein [Streptosporangium subroseum]SNT53881.1 Sugar kinase of the NBD/HSP70 family, may contain an N-terminal HTH domain [Streptosporangium subroseum]